MPPRPPLIAESDEVGKAFGLRYLLRRPQSDVPKPWPLVLFLHGAGERGASDGGDSKVDRLLVHGPWRAPWAKDCALLAPQCPYEEVWPAYAHELVDLVRQIQSLEPIDCSRCYAMGLSLGGFGVWSAAVACPELFAAVVPICGGFAPPLPRGTNMTMLRRFAKAEPTPRLADVRRLPAWIFHGAKDKAVNLFGSKGVYQALGGDKRGQSQLRITIFETSGHNIWGTAFRQPGLFPWLLEHQRCEGAAQEQVVPRAWNSLVRRRMKTPPKQPLEVIDASPPSPEDAVVNRRRTAPCDNGVVAEEPKAPGEQVQVSDEGNRSTSRTAAFLDGDDWETDTASLASLFEFCGNGNSNYTNLLCPPTSSASSSSSTVPRRHASCTETECDEESDGGRAEAGAEVHELVPRPGEPTPLVAISERPTPSQPSRRRNKLIGKQQPVSVRDQETPAKGLVVHVTETTAPDPPRTELNPIVPVNGISACILSPALLKNVSQAAAPVGSPPACCNAASAVPTHNDADVVAVDVVTENVGPPHRPPRKRWRESSIDPHKSLSGQLSRRRLCNIDGLEGARTVA
eukprot:TRINITY_DN19897_c0_g1_i1.p1 TRINITY_DN19897_c0_g1~~TRINITY_DN19897_c0_g1_i1.p1  ORF type:complete len:572 (-),score=95.80 TRINITY_DN19897_c0_g1_i1:32-1747(-)